MDAVHIGTDRNHMDNSSVKWFEISGQDFDGTQTYGLAQRDGEDAVIVDCDGCPVTVGDGVWHRVNRALGYPAE
jgi:hypothetical protein